MKIGDVEFLEAQEVPVPQMPRRKPKTAKALKETLLDRAGDSVFELPKLNLQTIEVTVIGDTPLIMHQWSAKARKEMLDKQMKKARQGKEAKDPKRDFEEATYRHQGRYAFPAIAFKSAAVTACTSIGGVTKVQARQAFRVQGEFVIIEGSEPIMREDMVRVGMGTADLRYRPAFMPWWAVLTVSYNANVMSAEQIMNMLNTAGFGVGIGDWRPEKNGQYGCFHVATDTEMAAIRNLRVKANGKAGRMSPREAKAIRQRRAPKSH